VTTTVLLITFMSVIFGNVRFRLRGTDADRKAKAQNGLF
jgi:hypothetical protein